MAGSFARRRARRAALVAGRLATAVRLLPEGCAEIAPDRLGTDAVARRLMAALIRAVGGGEHAPPEAAVAALLARGSGSLGGAVWLRSGRWLVPEAGAGPGRFRLNVPEGLVAGTLGPDAAAFRARARHLPAAALVALPAFRRPEDGKLALTTHLAYLRPEMAVSSPPVFAPSGGPVTEYHFAG
jgi:tRNA(Ile)-lysidine synthase